MNLENLVGTYTIIGSNQDDSENTYKGTLTLTLDSNNRVAAKWLIHHEQEQIGTGFFKDNILVVNFSYQGDDGAIYKGTVVYRCLTNDILDGFWSEEDGDPQHLGTERCFKITHETTSIN